MRDEIRGQSYIRWTLRMARVRQQMQTPAASTHSPLSGWCWHNHSLIRWPCVGGGKENLLCYIPVSWNLMLDGGCWRWQQHQSKLWREIKHFMEGVSQNYMGSHLVLRLCVLPFQENSCPFYQIHFALTSLLPISCCIFPPGVSLIHEFIF